MALTSSADCRPADGGALRLDVQLVRFCLDHVVI
jgi:hypothetical protein